MALEIEGKVLRIFPEASGTSQAGRTWRKQQFLIETNEQYPKKVIFQLWGDNVDLLKDINVGQVVKVYFRVESREFNERWYTDLTAWRIMKFVDATPTSQGGTTQNTQPVPPSNEIYNTLEGQDDVFINNNETNTDTNTNNDLPTEQNQEDDDLPF